ncbi:MAG: ribonucleoside-diphosphate reductase subunit alpha, partial [Halobacteria archaeon]|nr:ribonucleoside-diphosphate reductase subunit alpha [Halobacteria archaeon]
DRIPGDIKELYRGAFEIDPRHQMTLTARRSQWIDQSVSHNVFFPSTDGSKLDDIYQTAWELGMKTTYYLRTLGASQIEKSTLDMEKYGKTQKRGTQSETDSDSGCAIGDGGTTDENELPGVEDPTCEACQ